MSKSKTSIKENSPKFPVYLGELACGLFGIGEDFVDSHLSLDQKFMKNKESIFFIRSGGDSMIPEVKSGDILIVDRSLEAKSGSIIALFFNGSPICKQLILLGGKRILRSFNQTYQDVEVGDNDEVQIFGVIIGLARDFV